ncbi:MAG TPA: hypothetical protein VJP78_12170 [Thermoleophilia bacterium]|nr:hypothetical protein [Thermoleophilia bacterium]
MTFKVPRWLALGLGAVIVMAAISWVVTNINWELRGVPDAECAADVLVQYVDGSERLLGERPVYPTSPSQSASATVWDSYSSEFSRYERDYTAWESDGDALTREYIDGVRSCLR